MKNTAGRLKKAAALIAGAALLLSSAPAAARAEEKGVDVVVETTAGLTARGELIGANDRDLILMSAETGEDLRFRLEDIAVLAIHRKSEALAGGILGAIGGCFAGGLIAQGSFRHDPKPNLFSSLGDSLHNSMTALAGGMAGLLVGGIAGAVLAGAQSGDSKHEPAGMTPKQRARLVARLQPLARVRDYR